MMYGTFPPLSDYVPANTAEGVVKIRVTDDPNHNSEKTTPAEGAYVFETGFNF